MTLETIQKDERFTHLALLGRLDIKGVQEVEISFLAQTAARGKPVLVDLAGVEYMSSMGLRMLLSAERALKGKGSRLLLFRPSPLVRETIASAGLGVLITERETPSDAQAELLAEASC